MERLEALAEKVLGDWKDISHIEKPGYIVYDLEQGEAVSFTLKDRPYVHVLDTLITADTIFPLHGHAQSFETLILQKGEVSIVCDEPGCTPIHHEMIRGEPFGIPKGISHFIHAKKTSWILATLIPPDADMLK